MTRIAIAGFVHETNTFAPMLTPLEEFGFGRPSYDYLTVEQLLDMRGKKFNYASCGYVDGLDELGYDDRDEEGYRVYGYYGQRITLDLAVNGESSAKVAAANAIKTMLVQIGVDVNVIEYSYQAYLLAVENGATELYIAETKISADMDISPLIAPDGEACYGFVSSDELAQTWLELHSGGSSFEEFDETFYAVTPFAPLVYRHGDFVYSRSFYFDVEPTESDIFYNILQWR